MNCGKETNFHSNRGNSRATMFDLQMSTQKWRKRYCINHCSTRVEQQLKELKLGLKLEKVFRAEVEITDFYVIPFQITQLGIITLGKIHRFKIKRIFFFQRNNVSSSSPKNDRILFIRQRPNLSCSLLFFFFLKKSN